MPRFARGSRDVGLFSAPDRAGEAHHDGAALDRDGGVARIHGFDAVGLDPVEEDHLHSFATQGPDQPVMLGTELVPVGHSVGLEVPALLQVPVGTNFFDPLVSIDDFHLVTRAMHEAETDLPDVVVAAPPRPHIATCCPGALECRLGVGTEELDGLVVDAGHCHPLWITASGEWWHPVQMPRFERPRSVTLCSRPAGSGRNGRTARMDSRTSRRMSAEPLDSPALLTIGVQRFLGRGVPLWTPTVPERGSPILFAPPLRTSARDWHNPTRDHAFSRRRCEAPGRRWKMSAIDAAGNED